MINQNVVLNVKTSVNLTTSPDPLAFLLVILSALLSNMLNIKEQNIDKTHVAEAEINCVLYIC